MKASPQGLDDNLLRDEAFYLFHYLNTTAAENLPRLYRSILGQEKYKVLPPDYRKLFDLPFGIFIQSLPHTSPMLPHTPPMYTDVDSSYQSEIRTNLNRWRMLVHPELVTYIFKLLEEDGEGRRYSIIPIGLASDAAAHLNLLRIYVEKTVGFDLKISIQRFEPYYGLDHAPDDERYTNTDERAPVNKLLKEGLQNILNTKYNVLNRMDEARPVSVKYYDISKEIKARVGPQVIEESVERRNEEAVGYCVFWSMAFLESAIDVSLRERKDVLEVESILIHFGEIIRSDQKVERADGVIPPDVMRKYIRKYVGGYIYNHFREDIQTQSLPADRTYLLWKYISQTIDYQKIFDMFGDRDTPLGFKPLPKITITRYTGSVDKRLPGNSAIGMCYPFGGKHVCKTSDTEVYEYEGVVDIADEYHRIGLIVRIDTETGIEHVNVLVLLPHFDAKSSVDSVDMFIFEPLGSGIQEPRIWREALKMSLDHVRTSRDPKPPLRFLDEVDVSFSKFTGPQTFERYIPRDLGETTTYAFPWCFHFIDQLLSVTGIETGVGITLTEGPPPKLIGVNDPLGTVSLQVPIQYVKPIPQEVMKLALRNFYIGVNLEIPPALNVSQQLETIQQGFEGVKNLAEHDGSDRSSDVYTRFADIYAQFEGVKGQLDELFKHPTIPSDVYTRFADIYAQFEGVKGQLDELFKHLAIPSDVYTRITGIYAQFEGVKGQLDELFKHLATGLLTFIRTKTNELAEKVIDKYYKPHFLREISAKRPRLG